MHDVIRLKQVDHVKNEKNILSEIHHPFIVDLLWFYKDKNLLYMLFPYVCGGELFSYLRRLLDMNGFGLIFLKLNSNNSSIKRFFYVFIWIFKHFLKISIVKVALRQLQLSFQRKILLRNG